MTTIVRRVSKWLLKRKCFYNRDISIGESEKMTPQFYLGTAIILVSVLSYPVMNYWNKRRKIVRTLG